jgi:serine/threonine-protein kinase
MELLSGVSLEAFVRVRRRLPPAEVLNILEPLCAALDAVHQQGVIHRDLKASNIFLAERDNGPRRVTLLDFGVAKLLDTTEPGLTSPSKIVGTPVCMAPEQIRGDPASPQTDVYALGVLSYFMLTGELPFSDPSFLLIQTMHLHVNPERPSSVAPVSPVFDGVVLRALSKNPETRYASPLDLCAAFRTAVDRARRYGRGSVARRGLALHVEVNANPDDLEEPDEALCADMEAVLPLAARVLSAHGFAVAVWTGNRVVLAANLSDDPERDKAARREAIRAAMALLAELSRRATRDPRVRVLVHIDVVTEGGAPESSLAEPAIAEMILSAERGAECLVASTQALEGIDIDARPIQESTSLYRVIETVIA